MEKIYTNPFVISSPVRPNIEAFVLREPLLERVRSRLLNNRLIALTGPRSVGKTTFLLTIKEHPPDNFVPVLVDIQKIFATSSEILFRTLSSDINDSLQSYGIKYDLWSDTKVCTAREFYLYVEKVIEHLGNENKKLLLLFDEYDSLKAAQSEDLSQVLRALVQHSGQDSVPGIVLCGSFVSHTFAQGVGSPLLTILTTFFLDYFSQEEVLNLFRNIFSTKMQSSNALNEFAEAVFYWTSGHPLFTQSMGSLAYPYICSDESKLDLTLVEKLVNELIARHQLHIRGMLDFVNPSNARILAELLEGASIEFSIFVDEIEALYLAGLIRDEKGKCKISSRIHEKVLRDFLYHSEEVSHQAQEIELSEADLWEIAKEVIRKR